MTEVPKHKWKHRVTQRGVLWVELEDRQNALVRCSPMPNNRYLWQFRNFTAYANTIEEAINYVEAGAEFFDVMHRNPYI